MPLILSTILLMTSTCYITGVSNTRWWYCKHLILNTKYIALLDADWLKPESEQHPCSLENVSLITHFEFCHLLNTMQWSRRLFFYINEGEADLNNLVVLIDLFFHFCYFQLISMGVLIKGKTWNYIHYENLDKTNCNLPVTWFEDWKMADSYLAIPEFLDTFSEMFF